MNSDQGASGTEVPQPTRRELPTRVHRIAGAALLVGILLVLAGMGIESQLLRRVSIFTFAGAACLLAAADVLYMLQTGQGLGRLSGHVNRLVNARSFYLHIAIRVLFFALFGVALVLSLALKA